MTLTNDSDSGPVAASGAGAKVPVTIDTKGRVRASKEQRQAILDGFARSGVSAVQFAKQTGLKYSTLAGWLQRYRRSKPLRRARPLRLLEAVVESGSELATGGGLVLELPGGIRLLVADQKQVALAAVLVRELAKPC